MRLWRKLLSVSLNMDSLTSMTYFELFAITEGFQVDLGELKAKYLELQRAVHPDKFANASERERLMAVQKAAQINDAYGVLSKTDTRAQYLLELAGIELAHETQTLKDPMFLIQQMELRESLEDITSSDNPEQALIDFQDQISDFIKEINDQFVALFALNDLASLAKAADLVRKLKFMLKLAQEAQRIEEKVFAF